MDISADKYKSDVKRPGLFLAVKRAVIGFVTWLVGFVILSDRDRSNAGIYYNGEQRD
jgi:hypothetical protein